MRRATLLLAFLAMLALLAACNDKKESNGSNQLPTATGAPKVAAGVDHGLLLPRDQRLLLRDMAKGNEALIGTAPPDAYYAWPRWAPDGKSIAYVFNTLYTGSPNQDWGGDIGVSAPDGSNARIAFK